MWKRDKKIMKLIMFFVVIINIANLATLPIPSKEKFDKSIAEEILMETYQPLVNFVRTGNPVQGEELLLAPDNIKSENDFIMLFDNKIDNKNKFVDRFFEDLVIEKQGDLYIDKKRCLSSKLSHLTWRYYFIASLPICHWHGASAYMVCVPEGMSI